MNNLKNELLDAKVSWHPWSTIVCRLATSVCRNLGYVTWEHPSFRERYDRCFFSREKISRGFFDHIIEYIINREKQ